MMQRRSNLISREELPYLGDSPAERAPELFFAKHGLETGTIVEVGNVFIPGVSPDLCIDLLEGPVKKDARYYTPPNKYDNVISISTVEHFGMGDEFDWRGPLEGLNNLVKWLKPGGFFYVTVPFGKPTPGLERKAGDWWAQFYPPFNIVTFMPFTSEYIRVFRKQHADWLNFFFLKRVDIKNNRWAFCEESDVVDSVMLDDGASAILIITNKDLRLMNVKDLPPVMLQTTADRCYKYAVRLYRALKKPHMYFEYATRIYRRIRAVVAAGTVVTKDIEP